MTLSRIALVSLLATSVATPALAAATSNDAVAEVAAEAGAADDAAADADASRGDGNAIVVVGSTRATTVLQSSTPVDVVSNQEIGTGGVVLNQALQHILPSFQFPQGQNASKGSSGIRSASLRGLSPDLTLVLVDGKRLHNSAQTGGVDPWPGSNYVDINQIPVSALARAEVLRDGASAQYGSDAIAGVLNLVLRRDDHGGGINAEVGQYYEGDGPTRAINGWAAAPLPGDGFINVSADLSYRGQTDRSGPDIRRRYFLVDAGGNSVVSASAPTNYSPSAVLPAGLSWDPREITADRNSVGAWGNAQVRHDAFLVNAETGLSSNVRLYGWFDYSYTRTQNGVNPQVPSADAVVRALFPNGFQPITDVRLTDYTGTLGLKIDGGSLGKFDLSANYGTNILDRFIHNLDAPSYGLASQTDFYLGQYRSDQVNANLDWSKDADLGLSNPVQLIGGLSYRHETWGAYVGGDEQSWNNGGVPVLDGPNAGAATRWGTADASGLGPWDLGSRARTTVGGYLGFDVRPVDPLLISVTGRYEHYSDFGGTATGKIALRYDITPTFALRGSVSNGYRAPSIGQIQNQSTGFSSNWSHSGTVLTTTRTRTYRPDSAVAIALGGGALKPEKSVNLSAGAVWQPSRDLSFTVDAYQIKLSGLILLAAAATGNGLTGTVVTDATTAAGDANITAASFLTNGMDTRTRGVDAVGRFHHQFDFGEVTLTAGYSLMSTRAYNLKTGVAGATLFTRGQKLDLERGTPQNKLLLGQVFTRGPWTLQVDEVRYGSYWYTHPTTAAYDEYYGPDWFVNAEVRVQVTPKLQLAAGGRNIFDVYPHQYLVANQVNGINRYGFIHPEGASGGYWYGRLSYNF
ncbi:TonB-dependent receptor [Novosphingobium flavum]|uniref:TonB-dependent receptor n=1 Tax=Novosphingobium flavum TaxID=1778672 RepID=A0A7X1FRF7_9SPHN|nr:TonB-dependent receptor [Novosphingobium flavum]MBC2665454.1 TonB-dependent receptor [Novosphingobium flavum]